MPDLRSAEVHATPDTMGTLQVRDQDGSEWWWLVVPSRWCCTETQTSLSLQFIGFSVHSRMVCQSVCSLYIAGRMSHYHHRRVNCELIGFNNTNTCTLVDQGTNFLFYWYCSASSDPTQHTDTLHFYTPLVYQPVPAPDPGPSFVSR